MTGFEPQISGVGSNRFTNWATTTAQFVENLDWPIKVFFNFYFEPDHFLVALAKNQNRIGLLLFLDQSQVKSITWTHILTF